MSVIKTELRQFFVWYISRWRQTQSYYYHCAFLCFAKLLGVAAFEVTVEKPYFGCRLFCSLIYVRKNTRLMVIVQVCIYIKLSINTFFVHNSNSFSI